LYFSEGRKEEKKEKERKERKETEERKRERRKERVCSKQAVTLPRLLFLSFLLF